MAKKDTNTPKKEKRQIRSIKHWGIPEEDKTDRAYWDMPFIERAYFRLLYAGMAFLLVACFFDTFHVPFVAQCFLGGVVALSVLLWRVAYPNGFSGVMGEAMQNGLEAAKKQQELLDSQRKNDKNQSSGK